MIPNDANLFGDSLKAIAICPSCNNRYDPVEAKVLIEKEGAHLIHIQCRHCQTSVLAVILSNSLGISSVGLMTDLDIDDVFKFKNSRSVNHDDVIEMHQVLAKERAVIDNFI